MSAVTHPKHPREPHVKQGHVGPLDWRKLVEWLSEDGVISAAEAQQGLSRIAFGHQLASATPGSLLGARGVATVAFQPI